MQMAWFLLQANRPQYTVADLVNHFFAQQSVVKPEGFKATQFLQQHGDLFDLIDHKGNQKLVELTARGRQMASRGGGSVAGNRTNKAGKLARTNIAPRTAAKFGPQASQEIVRFYQRLQNIEKGTTAASLMAQDDMKKLWLRTWTAAAAGEFIASASVVSLALPLSDQHVCFGRRNSFSGDSPDHAA